MLHNLDHSVDDWAQCFLFVWRSRCDLFEDPRFIIDSVFLPAVLKVKWQHNQIVLILTVMRVCGTEGAAIPRHTTVISFVSDLFSPPSPLLH